MLAKWEGNGFVIHECRACANCSAATTSCARPTPTSSATWGRRAPQGRFTQEQLISLPPEPGGRPFPGAWGMKGLPIAFTPAREQQRELA
ncbi:hypothetical protein HNO88_000541 [Novosphingobium chloroacetimidivorans]|uniref:Uncharacterized protein n=1 Tax=Novosphingobium chloroacetimidivorans TaxID=1428314 RepID=A0A7W7K6M5_9SPHN|nr:hypothetical protein [Novosphingobium chloroacetimidivorans]MBB4857234.1 hypothetical protein [Novosphingobium chloroacetimidivorans]